MDSDDWHRRLEQRLAIRPACDGRPMSTGAAAAVLVVLLETQRAPEVLLERRADHLARHAGQYALPGGRIDARDAGPEAAALREAEEEVGLTADRVKLLGRLSDRRTSTGWRITPVVGVSTDPGRMAPDPGEVAELIRVPVSALIGPSGFRTVVRRQRGLRITDLAMVWRERHIWGATARILRELGRVLDGLDDGWD